MIQYEYDVFLRAIEREDLPLLFKWRNDPRIYRWCRQYEPLSWEHHEAWFESLANRTDVKMYAICHVRDKDVPNISTNLVGAAGFTSIDYINRRAEFSIYINAQDQDKHLARPALYTLFCHGFKNLGFNVIWGETYQNNPAIGLFERCGMIKEGTRRQFYYREGKFIDAHLYSVTREEWEIHLLSDLSRVY